MVDLLRSHNTHYGHIGLKTEKTAKGALPGIGTVIKSALEVVGEFGLVNGIQRSPYLLTVLGSSHGVCGSKIFQCCVHEGKSSTAKCGAYQLATVELTRRMGCPQMAYPTQKGPPQETYELSQVAREV